MMELNALRTDPKKSIEGTWVDYIHGTRLLIARYDNKVMQSYRNARFMENSKVFGNVDANREEALRLSEEIEVDCLANYVLLDWEGFSQNKEEVKYTPELGAKIFADETYAEFRTFVSRIASNSEHFRIENEVEAAEQVKDTAAS